MTPVSLGILAGCELASTPLAFPLWQASNGLLSCLPLIMSQCSVSFVCKSLLLLLGVRLVPLAFGEIEESLWALLVEKL
jgi:hypothetical protein